jgi:hypothetical protein
MDEVSINTAHGRILIPMGIGKYGEIPFRRIRGAVRSRREKENIPSYGRC